MKDKGPGVSKKMKIAQMKQRIWGKYGPPPNTTSKKYPNGKPK